MSKKKRKIKLIDRGFQYKLMGKFVFINTIILMLFGAIIYVFFKSEISANLASAHATYTSVSQMLLPIIIILSLLAILITSIIIIMVVLSASHKIAGPLYRFNEALKEIETKNLKPFSQIRSDDQLKELSESFSKMTDILASDLTIIKKLTSELSNMVKNHDEKVKVNEISQIISEYKLD